MRPPPTFRTAQPRIDGVAIGTLVGFADGGATPLVTYPDQPATAALPARATVDLHAAHIGRQAVLMFEEGDPDRPIIVGCLQASIRLRRRSGVRTGRGRCRRRAAGRVGEGSDRSSLRQGQHHAHEGRQADPAGRIRVESVVRRAAHQGRLRSDQLSGCLSMRCRRTADDMADFENATPFGARVDAVVGSRGLRRAPDRCRPPSSSCLSLAMTIHVCACSARRSCRRWWTSTSASPARAASGARASRRTRNRRRISMCAVTHALRTASRSPR